MLEINKILENLKDIKQVDSPDFLFTRIEAKISALKKEKVSNKILILTAVSFSLLFFLNISAIKKHQKRNKQETEFYNSIDIIPDNQLY
jgi:hypothetical protein